MKKTISVLLAALLMATWLSACGSGGGSANSTDNGGSGQATESGGAPEGSPPGNSPGDFPGGKPPDGVPGGQSGGTDIVYTAAVEIPSTDSQDGQTYASSTADENALLISAPAEVSVSNPTVTKSGDSDGGD